MAGSIQGVDEGGRRVKITVADIVHAQKAGAGFKVVYIDRGFDYSSIDYRTLVAIFGGSIYWYEDLSSARVDRLPKGINVVQAKREHRRLHDAGIYGRAEELGFNP